MKIVTVSIDTRDRITSIVSLECDGKKETESFDAPQGTGTAVLSLTTSLLATFSLKISDITEIRVSMGPGSYTGLRVGASIANTLSWLLKIPVNNQPHGSVITPHYT